MNEINLLIIGFIVATILTLLSYCLTKKSKKPIPNLGDAKISPSVEKINELTNRLITLYEDFERKVNSIILVSDFGKEIQTKAERNLFQVVFFLYLFAIVTLMKNYPNPTESQKWILIYLITFGAVGVIALSLAYFKSIKIISDFLIRRHIINFLGKNIRLLKNIDAFLSSYNFKNKNQVKNFEQLRNDLNKLTSDLANLKEILKTSTNPIFRRFLTSLGYIIPPVIPSIYALYQSEFAWFQNLLPIIVVVIILPFSYLFAIPRWRQYTLLSWLNILKSEKEFTEALTDLTKALLGKDVSEIVMSSLLIFAR